MKHRKLAFSAMIIATVFAGCALFTADSGTVDWNRVPTKTLTLFYPGQSSYQWVRSADHPGSSMVATGGACVTCHNGQEEKLGNKLVKANALEPTPVDGKNGVIQLSFQVAYDSENAYFRDRKSTRLNSSH